MCYTRRSETHKFPFARIQIPRTIPPPLNAKQNARVASGVARPWKTINHDKRTHVHPLLREKLTRKTINTL